MAGRSIQHADGSRTFVDYADGEGSAIVNGRKWRWEFHEYCGPMFVRADGYPRKNQCPTVKAVWDAFTRWHKQYERAKNAGSTTLPGLAARPAIMTAGGTQCSAQPKGQQ
jgi:hypothetical protein